MTDTAINLRQCEYKTAKGRQCKLEYGHETKEGASKEDKKHRMVLASGIAKPPTMAELKAKGITFDLKMEVVPKATDVSRDYQRAAAPRDDDQKRVDGDAKKAYDKWAAAGKPTGTLEDLVKKGLAARYLVPPAAFDTVIAMLRRANTAGGPLPGKPLAYRRKTHESGNTMIVFAFTDRQVKPEVVASITGQRS